MMNKLVLIIALLSAGVFAQYRDNGFPTTSVRDGITDNSGLFGLNTNNFQMRHTYSLSYSAFGNDGTALGVYTNSLFYKFSNDLNIQADISLVHSPYSSFGSEYQKSLNGIYLSRAAVNYRPWKDFQINVLYQNVPNNYYPGYYNGFYNGYNNRFMNGFERDPFWGY